jgi:hypothetical protein
LSAVKVTGKTDGGLSVGVLQSLTQEETARIVAPAFVRRAIVEPAGSYAVARVHKDWDKGNTSLGGMVTQTHRFIGEEFAPAALPADALTGGVDFIRYFGNRGWRLDASGLFSNVSGSRDAIRELQTSPVHYYQRADADHLGVDEGRTSLAGHGGYLRAGTSDTRRLRLTDRFHWYSPGLDLNDVGYLRQADVLGNEVSLGWAEPRPRGIFRDYFVGVSREDAWDFGGLRTRADLDVQASGTFKNRWGVETRLSYNQDVDTGALRGGPALRTHDFVSFDLGLHSDGSRRVSFSAEGDQAWSLDDDSTSTELETGVRLRLSNRLALSGEFSYERLLNDLQYVTTADSSAGPRYLLGRIDQDTYAVTFRANLALTPDLTFQYYGSPFISTARYATFKRATDTLAESYEQRFHRYAPGEISARPGGRVYDVAEADGTSYSFGNPDFSFRQFRSNAVLRWEFRPGSALYGVWSQGRTGEAPFRESRFGSNWDELWRMRADNVFLVKLSYWFSP